MMLGAWVTAVTALVLVVPGALVGRRMTLPWPVAIAAGPPITLAIVGVFTVVYSVVGFEWNVWTALLALVITLLAGWAYAAALRSRRLRGLAGPTRDDDEPLDRRGTLALAAGAVLGGAIIAITCIRPLVITAAEGLDSIPQVWDSLWHASSLRWIHETGIGSALRMGELMNYDTHGFNYYPNTWHALGAILFPITGANPVELYNTYSPAVLAVTIPFGVASLAYWFARHRLAPDRAAFLAGTAAAISGLFPSLPYVEVELTSVPNAVGVSIAPIAAILVISAVRDRRRVLPAAIAVSGVTATHPSGLILAGVIVVLWWLCEGLWRPAYGRLRDLATLAVTGALTLVLIAPVVLGTIAVADTNTLPFFDFREETVGVLDGLAQAAFNGTVPLGEVSYPVWGLIVATIAGLGVLAWLRCWAGLATWAAFVLVTANAVVSLGPLSYPLGAIGGYFYNSPHRLTFVVALFSAAVAGIALGMLALGVAALVSRWTSSEPAPMRQPSRRWVIPATAAVLMVLVAGAAVWRYPTNAQIATKHRDGKLVGADDLAAYHWLEQQPGARDSLILNNLDQGTGWIYPVTGLTPMFAFYRANDFSQRQRDLFWGVSQIGADPYIDGIVRDLNVHYVIDSPPSYWPFQNGVPDPDHGVQGDPFLALRRQGAPGLTPVFRQGNVTVFEVNEKVYPEPTG
ncbi:DUF6541 family protein [Gordonia rhizosphera]|uniref:Uncharacterized protein n=1 Tax=Gordonia rhizosphera NBRC 16068 TaxID=1108045 RepID=K6W5T7_9ACTN|nr:DUF6541 family protein [Gordonia rhizosphera]GAB89066.1 hypothetical protein GORHZ_048_00430 [Gordonia rhizosphera NBRC 16068]